MWLILTDKRVQGVPWSIRLLIMVEVYWLWWVCFPLLQVRNVCYIPNLATLNWTNSFYWVILPFFNSPLEKHHQRFNLVNVNPKFSLIFKTCIFLYLYPYRLKEPVKMKTCKSTEATGRQLMWLVLITKSRERMDTSGLILTGPRKYLRHWDETVRRVIRNGCLNQSITTQ